MRSIRYYVAASLDGFIAREDGSYDFFIHDDELVADMIESLQKDYTAVVMGRSTYDIGLADGKTNPYPWLDTYVISRTLETTPDEAVTLLRSIDDIAALKQGDGGDIWLCGGGNLAGQLLRRGLIDEVTIKTNPVFAGTGIPLFADLDAPCALQPRGESKRYESGIVVTRYRCPQH